MSKKIGRMNQRLIVEKQDPNTRKQNAGLRMEVEKLLRELEVIDSEES